MLKFKLITGANAEIVSELVNKWFESKRMDGIELEIVSFETNELGGALGVSIVAKETKIESKFPLEMPERRRAPESNQ